MRVLLADDDPDVLLALELLLEHEKIESERASSPVEVLAQLERSGAASAGQGASASARDCSFDALLLDLNYERDTTSGREGFALLERLRVERPRLPVVVMTGWASIEGAVEAMRRGAVDYVPKPWDNARLIALLRRLSPAGAAERHDTGTVLVHASAAMRQLHTMIGQVAFSDVSILITGEHGTGKELIARAIHEQSGRRGAFVAINAGALADGTFESELFGHVRGAFTDAKVAREGAFARAEGGTLFLDEIANMPLSQQAKLLRVLQERLYQPLGAAAPRASTARVVAATNMDLDHLVHGGSFRPDLLYRLNTLHLHVPPLRERLEELPGLVQRFTERETERYGLPVPRLASGVMERLMAHAWPGNVRELEHVIQRAVLLSAGRGPLTEAHLDLRLPEPDASAPASEPRLTRDLAEPPQTVQDAQKAAILRALQRFPGDRRAAAESLGLSRSAFYRRLALYGIRPPK
jgi:DNA-binding NtrC family response regulator